MHFALPPRKTSQPPIFSRAAALHNASQRRRKLQRLSYVVLGTLSLYLFWTWLSSANASEEAEEIEATPSVVLVTVFNEQTMSATMMDQVRKNREDYAERHGYTNFFTNVSTYNDLVFPSPVSWATVPALRHALTLYPTTNYLWSLSAHSLITSPSLSLSAHIFNNLTDLMQKDIPVVPPDSVIRTFSHLKPTSCHLIMAQDMDNLAHTSILMRNSPTFRSTGEPDNWAMYFLDAWFDPLYRSYAFQKAEQHALEHIVQWHPTVLAKLALIPQRMLVSYNFAYEDEGGRSHDAQWQPGDFVVDFKDCDITEGRSCEKEMAEYYARWENEVKRLDGDGSG
jgi:mannan polymerase II complex MNN11 subunit